jgi:hypothetical protein
MAITAPIVKNIVLSTNSRFRLIDLCPFLIEYRVNFGGERGGAY